MVFKGEPSGKEYRKPLKSTGIDLSGEERRLFAQFMTLSNRFVCLLRLAFLRGI